MALPTPTPGLVLRYSYLWHREHVDGREEGRKDRPCAVIAAIRTDEDGNIRVVVVPITHRPPDRDEATVEQPAKVKARLHLDEARSWVVLSEWNEFVWPGPDLRRIPGSDDASVAYGILPPALFAVIRDRFITMIKRRTARPVPRD